MEDSLSIYSLLCAEGCTSLDDSKGGVPEINSSFSLDSEDEYIWSLVERESSFHGSDACSIEGGGWDECARRDVIRWIAKVRMFYNFGYHTAFLSLNYLDRVLARCPAIREKDWAIHLSAVACLSLAAKMEELVVPRLLDLQVENPKFMFEPKLVQRMELLVLDTLAWRLNVVTPFSFLKFFMTRLCHSQNPKSLMSRSIDLILTTSEVMNFTDNRPSAIAAASILISSGRELTKESTEFTMGFIEHDCVLSCYNLMRKLETDKCKIPRIAISPNLLPSPVGVIEAAQLSTSSPNSKRRKLLDYGDDYEFSDGKRLN
ncbi:hypothetical protein AMTRI_Chr12g237980 [Amborella trichopoda]